VGAAVAAAITIALYLFMRRLARSTPLPDLFEWQQLTLAPVIVGALLGSYSHIILDGMMHADMRPFAPWSDANPFLRAVSLGTLHWACVILGIAGVLLWLKTRPSRPRSVSPDS